MAAILNEQAQYVDASGKPLAGGSVYIGDVGADPVLNPKAIFSDRAMTSALANPQTLDANGRTANKIWTDGKYSLQVNDINGVQVFQDIDRGESAITIDILNDISDVITTPANNDTLIITRDEAQAKITFANLLGTVLLSLRGLTQAANKIPYFPSPTTSGQLDFVDENDMGSDSNTALPSQRSVKAYVDAKKANSSTTSGTAVDFTSIPSRVTEIEFILSGVSLSGTDDVLFQLSTSSTFAVSGYVSTNINSNNASIVTFSSTDGFFVAVRDAADSLSGVLALRKFGDSNKWSARGDFLRGTTKMSFTVGEVTLAGVLDGVRIASSGTDTFDAGEVDVRYKVR